MSHADVVVVVGRAFGVCPTEILERRRGSSSTISARAAACWIMHYRLGWSWGRIGAGFGRGRHTVMAAARRCEWRMMHFAGVILMTNEALAMLGQQQHEQRRAA